LEKYSNIKFHENPSSGSRGIQFGRTDRHVTKLIRSYFSQFCKQTAKYMNRYTGTCRFGVLEKLA